MSRLQRLILRTLRTAIPGFDRQLLQRDILTEFQRALAFQQGKFPGSIVIPPNFGKGMPERVPELLLAALSYQPGVKVLDVGYANAMKCHLNMIDSLASPKNFTGIDIVPASYDATPYYSKMLTADMAGNDSLDERFDLIWCISTLEHIGMDNSSYQKDFRLEQAADFRAIENMFRLLSPAGKLLVTVPYGREEDHGWLRNYHRERWQNIIALTRESANITEWYFKHTYGSGWNLALSEELAHVGYYDQNNSGAGGLAAVLIENQT